MTILLALLVGCDYGFTLPSDIPRPNGPVTPGMKLPFRPRRTILPGSVTGPPPPDAGITSGQCNDMTDGGELADQDCVTGEIHCGETIIGHTRGGVNRYNTRFYESNFCTPATTRHDGGDERVYLLDLQEEQTRAIVYLDTPCANLDLAALKSNGTQCPSPSTSLSQCEMWPQSGTKREKVDLWNNHASQWWLVVEGQGEEEGAFALTVQCLKW